MRSNDTFEDLLDNLIDAVHRGRGWARERCDLISRYKANLDGAARAPHMRHRCGICNASIPSRCARCAAHATEDIL